MSVKRRDNVDVETHVEDVTDEVQDHADEYYARKYGKMTEEIGEITIYTRRTNYSLLWDRNFRWRMSLVLGSPVAQVPCLDNVAQICHGHRGQEAEPEQWTTKIEEIQLDYNNKPDEFSLTSS